MQTGKRPPREVPLKRARVDVPVVEAEMRPRGGRKVAHVRLSSFTSGAHGEVRQAVDQLLDKGAEGVVLDLRNNGGGLLNEAVLVSSIFIPDGTIVSTKGRTRPRARVRGDRRRDRRDIPVVVLVNGESASASEIVTGALQDRERAEVVGTRTFGKGVFQEVRQLSNGGALDITVGEYFTPKGRNLGGGGSRRAPGSSPTSRRATTTRRRRDEALDVAVRRRSRAECAPRGGRGAWPTPRRSSPCSSGAAASSPPSRSSRAGGASTSTSQPRLRGHRRPRARRADRPRAGHGRVLRRIGRPDVARDVLEALMLDRGLRRRFDPLVEREARAPARPPRTCRRADLRDLPTFTIDPPTARDFDDAISAPSGWTAARPRLGPHRRRRRPRPPGSAVDREALPARHQRLRPGKVEPMLPEALSNDACSLVPHQDRLAVTVELELEGATCAAPRSTAR